MKAHNNKDCLHTINMVSKSLAGQQLILHKPTQIRCTTTEIKATNNNFSRPSHSSYGVPHGDTHSISLRTLKATAVDSLGIVVSTAKPAGSEVATCILNWDSHQGSETNYSRSVSEHTSSLPALMTSKPFPRTPYLDTKTKESSITFLNKTTFICLDDRPWYYDCMSLLTHQQSR